MEKQQNKKTIKKYVIAGIVGILFIFASFLTIFSIVNFSKNNQDYVSFHFGDETEIVLEEEEMSKLENLFEFLYGIKEDFLNKQTLDETTDGSDGTEETNPVSTDELVAQFIVTIFFNYALTGYFTVGEMQAAAANGETGPKEGSILNPSSEDDWLAPNQTSFKNLLFEVALVTIYSNTTGAAGGSVKVNEYILNYAKYDYSVAENSYLLLHPSVITFWDAIDITYDAYESGQTTYGGIDTATVALLQNLSFRIEVNNFIYVYAYLWQESPSDNYDYFLTEEMAQGKYVIYWEISFLEDSIDEILDEGFTDGTAGTGTDYILGWNELVNLTGATADQNATLIQNGRQGYKGISSKNDSAIQFPETGNDSDRFWSYKSIYNYGSQDGDSFLTVDYDNFVGGSSATENVLLYHSRGTGQNGEVVDTDYLLYIQGTSSTDEETGETTETSSKYVTYSYFPLYPFAFPEGYSANSGNNGGPYAESWTYTIEAYYYDADSNGYNGENIYMTEEDLLIDYPTATSDQIVKINWFEFWFSDLDFYAYNSTIIDPLVEFTDVEYMEIYIIYEIFDYNETNKQDLENQTYLYWKSNGFYIELSGDYEQKYGNLIPLALQK